jgi:hypothetical protein
MESGSKDSREGDEQPYAFMQWEAMLALTPRDRLISKEVADRLADQAGYLLAGHLRWLAARGGKVLELADLDTPAVPRG